MDLDIENQFIVFVLNVENCIIKAVGNYVIQYVDRR